MILDVPSNSSYSMISVFNAVSSRWKVKEKILEVFLLPWFCQVKKEKIFQIFAKYFYMNNTCKRPEWEDWKRAGHNKIAITMKLFFNKIKLVELHFGMLWYCEKWGSQSSFTCRKGEQILHNALIKMVILTFCLWQGNLSEKVIQQCRFEC